MTSLRRSRKRLPTRWNYVRFITLSLFYEWDETGRSGDRL